MYNVRGASKIKLKNVNTKRMATARRQIFLEFLKASIADLITLFSVATATAAIILLTPAKNLKQLFLGFLVVSPLFNNFLG